jgi:ribosome-associated heat shock protein Hsp15
MSEDARQVIRLDRLLVYLRFARTRSVARSMIEAHSLRRNSKRVHRVSENVAIGDVLTLMIDDQVHVVEVVSLPSRRTSPSLAKSHYRELDPRGEMPLAARES